MAREALCRLVSSQAPGARRQTLQHLGRVARMVGQSGCLGRSPIKIELMLHPAEAASFPVDALPAVATAMLADLPRSRRETLAGMTRYFSLSRPVA